MWLAESYEFSPDFKRLTIKTRPGISWSDGKPFSAEDVAFTLNTLRDLGPKVRWGVDVQQAVEKATATDPDTVVIDFKIPAPRFFFFMTYKYDIGVYIVPKHIFEGQDWTTFKHFDLVMKMAGHNRPLASGGRLAAAEGLRPARDLVGGRAQARPAACCRTQCLFALRRRAAGAQALITNQLDDGNAMQPATFPTIFRQNPK